MKVLDLREQDGFWVFTFGGGDEFYSVLDRFKALVPLSDRRWNPKKKIWSVRQGIYDKVLGLVFENWDDNVRGIKAQGKLW